MNTLKQALITVVGSDDITSKMTLPGVFAALARDKVAGFAALRAHQRHPWHSFLVLLAAVALHRAGLVSPPEAETEWCDLLRHLTPDHSNDEPWCLVTAPALPALLQPPIPSGNLAELKNEITTPDGLDMLVTAKNHDLKQAVMTTAEAEDWLFALVTLQTMEGILGRDKYGISRMNGGFANRAAVSVAPPGGPSSQWQRDLHRVLALRGKLGAEYAAQDGLALVWLVPWDGIQSLRQDKLDEYYIEICRRVRLVVERGQLAARAGTSKVPRIVPLPGGVTGDPWSPVVVEKNGTIKSLTINGSGLGYRRMVEFMFNVKPAPLQNLAADDAEQGLYILARALVRGQGKTEGYHERRVKLSRKIKYGPFERPADMVADVAHQRVDLAGIMQNSVLKWALLALFQNGPLNIDVREKDSQRKAEVFLKRFDAAVDRDFFADLWREIDEDDADQRNRLRGVWAKKLLGIAEALLDDAEREAARSSRRHFRAVVRARDALHGSARRNDKIGPYLSESTAK